MRRPFNRGPFWVKGTEFHQAGEEADALVREIIDAASFGRDRLKVVTDPPVPHGDGAELVRAIRVGADLFFHYTDENGFRAIQRSRRLSSFRTDELREGARRLVYLSTPPWMLPPEQVHSMVFLGEPRYAERGDYLVAFVARLAVKDGTQPGEFTLAGSVELDAGTTRVVYAGPNPFRLVSL